VSLVARLNPVNRWLEPLLAIAIAIGIIHAFWFVWMRGFLPPPFFYEPSDLWMDWFNTAYWAHNEGAYDTWGTIYPPLSFVFLRIVGNPACYVGTEGITSRDCDWVGAVVLHAFFILNIFLIASTFMKIDRTTALPRSFAVAAGLPMLYGLERGNLIIPTFTCMLLAYGPLLKSARLRWLAAGLAINFKVYFIAALFPQLLRRRWRWFEGAIIAALMIYLITYFAYGGGTPIEIYNNITYISDVYQAIGFLDLWYASTYQPLLSLLDGTFFPILSLVGSDGIEFWTFFLATLQLSTQASICVAVMFVWVRPEAVPMFRLTNLGLLFALISIESNGYSQSIAILFIFMERWRGFGLKWAICISYILSIPADYAFEYIGFAVRESYISGQLVTFQYATTIGPFLRPLLIMSLPIALSCVTIRDVWLDIQRQGWKGRFRFRSDAPVMLGSA
jgi:hypothetical protein